MHLPYLNFVPPTALPRPSQSSSSISSRSPRRLRSSPRANLDEVPSSPSNLVESWVHTRSLSSTLDLSRRFVSILILSNNCARAAFAEKQLTAVAQQFSVSRRLLILSAGIHSNPGDLLPWHVVTAAKSRGIDLTDERPCASFDISDLEYYDFVVVLDRNVKEELMRMAEAHAHNTGGHLYEWERKIRLLCDFDGSMSVLQQGIRSGNSSLDVPTFSGGQREHVVMDMIQTGCENIVQSLLRAGL